MTVESDVSIPSLNGGRLPGFLVRPEDTPGSPPHPALLMVYEAFGMTAEMRRIARELAAEGYAVLVPDLFARGKVRALCVAATMATMTAGEGAALGDLESARRWLTDQPTVDADRIGTIGFCMGGGFALLLADTGMYKVSAPFYGRAPLPLQRACPVVGSYGGRDAFIGDYPDQLAADLERHGVPHDVKTYPEAGHSFMTRAEGALGSVLGRTPIHAEYHED
ncbi:dienelactone hydrolase family protein, partial [Pseudonocardia sp. KRD291]|uniref:dienelactone hydrolase family protein n=1 Tax=Pseudonocardia sp. KRD291 TaxID=2792007 RepID=UPI001C4A6349